MQGRIFISYRRADSQFATDRIYERLVDAFGAETVFMDIDNIPLGVNFRDYIDEQVSTSSVVLAVIGDRWLDAVDAEGNRRLENPSDFVRLEIEAALRQGIKLIPVFLGEVKAVPGHKLPKSLQELPMLNATRVRSGHDFIPDLDRLIRGIERISGEQDARRGRNEAALAALKQSAIEIKQQLAQVEALMIQETRKRTRLEKQALKFEAQVDDSLIDPGKLLLVDTSDFEQEIERLNEGLHELVLQVEARKQGLVTEEEATQQEPHPAQADVAIEPAAEMPAPKPERKPRKPKAAKPKPDFGKMLSKVPIWIWGAAAVVVIGVILGVVFGPDLYYQAISGSLAESSQPAPPADDGDDLGSDEAQQQSGGYELAVNPEVENWISEIRDTTPDFIEDFSIPQAYWDQERGINQVGQNVGVKEGALFISTDTEGVQEIGAGSYPFGSNALIQFEFTPLQIEQDTAVWVPFRVMNNAGYSLFYKATGDWQLIAFEYNLQTVLAEGTSEQLALGQTYIFTIFAYHNSLVVQKDHETFIYEIDDTYRNGTAAIDFDGKGAFEGRLDNIRVWDLSEIALYGEFSFSHDARAKDFYTPIRNYLANTTPTYQDDFETYRDYWEEMQVEFSDTKPVDLAVLVNNGEVALFSHDGLEYDRFVLSFPELTRQTLSSFAIQYDFRFNEPGSANLSTSVDTTWGPENNREHYSAYCDFHRDSQKISCGLYELNDSGKFLEFYNNQGRPLFKNMDETYTLLVIFYQGQFALFLDGYFMGYVDNLLNVEQTITINLLNDNPDDEFQVRFDNIKYWDLSNFVVDGDGDLPSEEIVEFTRLLLSHTNTQAPDFQEDFEAPQSYWSTMRLDTSENNPVYLSAVIPEGSDRHLFIDSSDEFLNSPDVSLMFDQAEARFFAFEFDFKPHNTVQGFDTLAVAFSQVGTSAEGDAKEYHFVIHAYQENKFTWSIESADGSELTEITRGEYEIPEFFFSEHKLSLFVYDDQLLVLLDQRLVVHHSGLDLARSGIRIHAHFNQPGPYLNFDNFKFWDLDGVSLQD